MRRFAVFLLSVLALAGAPAAASAQEASARTPLGVAQIEAGQGENGVRLAISISGAEPQVFDGVGEALVPLRAGNRTAPVIALDIDRDGIDEIFVRTSMQGQRGVLLVFRWDAGENRYAPVSFTEDTGAPKQFLLVNLTQPVTVKGNVVEAQNDSHVGGRLRQRVARYRWTGAGFEYSPDN